MTADAVPPEDPEVFDRLLRALGADGSGFDALYQAVHGELRKAARRQRLQLGAGTTLSTTALVNEAWIKLRNSRIEAHDRRHFIAIAACAMREIVIDYARYLSAGKRGGGRPNVALDEIMELPLDPEQAERLTELGEALEKLEAHSPRLAQVVIYRYFGGLEETEVGELLGITDRTVRRDWLKAKAFLAELLD